MKINRLSIPNKKFDINLKFYFWLKYLVKTKLSDKQSLVVLGKIIESSSYKEAILSLTNFADSIKGATKAEAFIQIIGTINDASELEAFLFGLRLYMIKDLLLAEAKLKEVLNKEELVGLDPLSLSYDNKSVYSPYATRVNGALLALLFFQNLEAGVANFITDDAHKLIINLSRQAVDLKATGLEPNQIFMLMFSESINQSIISDSGSNYEERILSVLIKIGIPRDAITKLHDTNDKSTEFDFFFKFKGRSFGVGAKRTLRERYKQFIKTAHTSKVDVFIEITLGLDLNEEKAKTIVGHDTVLFVADEIYQTRPFLQKIKGVYSVKSLNLKTLAAL